MRKGISEQGKRHLQEIVDGIRPDREELRRVIEDQGKYWTREASEGGILIGSLEELPEELQLFAFWIQEQQEDPYAPDRFRLDREFSEAFHGYGPSVLAMFWGFLGALDLFKSVRS